MIQKFDQSVYNSYLFNVNKTTRSCIHLLIKNDQRKQTTKSVSCVDTGPSDREFVIGYALASKYVYVSKTSWLFLLLLLTDFIGIHSIKNQFLFQEEQIGFSKSMLLEIRNRKAISNLTSMESPMNRDVILDLKIAERIPAKIQHKRSFETNSAFPSLRWENPWGIGCNRSLLQLRSSCMMSFSTSNETLNDPRNHVS